MALAGVIWLSFAWIQAALLVGSASGPRESGALFAFYGAIGIAWTVLTIPVAALTHALGSRRVGLAGAATAHLIGLLVCGLADTFVRRAATAALGDPFVIPWYGTLLYYADRTFVGYVVIVVLSRTLDAHDAVVARTRNALALEAQLTRARLSSLEEQLHPHFLFNCLGAVTELAHEAPAAAARMLTQLASVLRFGLQRGGAEVTVAEEIAALAPYLEVQRTRFADWISFECSIEPAARELLLPPLILQPLVENAIRHGLERRRAAGQIRVTAAVRDGRLVVDVRDNGVGLAAGAGAGRGIGTTNVRDRLAALYGADAELRVFEDEQGGAVSRVIVPVRTQREMAAVEALSRPESIADESIVPRGLRQRPVAAIVLAWAMWGLLWTQQSIAYLAFRGRLGNTTFGEIALHDFATAMLWAAVTPLMLAMLRVVPFDERRIGWRVAAHFLAALLIAMLHGALTHLVLGDPYAPFSAMGISAIAWGILAYAVVLIVAYHTRIRAWARDRELADARLRVEIADAELRSTTARTRPQQLLDRLEAIAGSIELDPSGAERSLARLGDELRAVLDARVRA